MKTSFIISLLFHTLFIFLLYQQENKTPDSIEKEKLYYQVETINESSLSLNKELNISEKNDEKALKKEVSDENKVKDYILTNKENILNQDKKNKEERLEMEIKNETVRVNKILEKQKILQSEHKRKHQKRVNREKENKKNKNIKQILEEKRKKKKIEDIKKKNQLAIADENKRKKIQKEEDERIRREENERKRLEMEALELKKIAYALNIKNKIYSNWIENYGEVGWECEIFVSQNRSGYITSFSFGKNCKRNDKFKETIKEAVYKSQPLPMPKDKKIFESNLNFTFIVE